MFYKYVCILCTLKKIVCYWLLSHLKFTVSMGGLLVFLWRGRADTTFFGLLFCLLFFLLLLNFLGKSEIILVVWLPNSVWLFPQSKCSVWSPSTFFSRTSDLIQVSSHSSHSPFLLFFQRSLVSLLLTKTMFSNILLHFPLEFQFFLLLIPPVFFSFTDFFSSA